MYNKSEKKDSIPILVIIYLHVYIAIRMMLHLFHSQQNSTTTKHQ